jgi:hypothetical protein
MYITDLNEWLVMNRIKSVLKEKGIKQTTLSEKLGKNYNMEQRGGKSKHFEEDLERIIKKHFEL